jgi:hypothetical protein
MNTKTVCAVFILGFSLLLSGCLAHMRATNVASNLNAKAEREGSPYRWVVIDLEGDKAKLEQQLAGETGASKMSDSKKQNVLFKIEQLDAKSGRATRSQLKEIRILSAALPMNQLFEVLTKKVVEAWVFDNSGNEIVYTVEHTPGTKDEEFVVKGPWLKGS